MEFAIGFDHIVGNPGSRLSVAFYLLAIGNNISEILIESHFEDITIENIYGEVVLKSQLIERNKQYVSFEKVLPCGIYLIKITNGFEQIMQKLIIEK